MRVSLIIAVYKDVEALELIFDSLAHQSYKNFEVVVAEDGECAKIRESVIAARGRYEFEIAHTTQEDLGIRKMRSLNNGIIASRGEYLVFIDGDCIPYTTFIEGHVRLSANGFILSGRICNMGPEFSNKNRGTSLTAYGLEKKFIQYFVFINKDNKEGHTEAGIYINPDSFLYKIFLKNRKSNINLLGCNYSCYKKDIVAINGYDEGYGETAIGDDTDLQWRFEAFGLQIKSVKNVANQFHLYHSREFRKKISYKNEWKLFLENKEKNNYICKFGLNTH